MKSLLDSGKFIGPLASVRQVARQCNLQFPVSVAQLLNTVGCPFTLCNHIHIKVLTNPSLPGGINKMLSNMRRVYSTGGIAVEVMSREFLTGSDLAPLNDLDVGACDSSISPEQAQLYQNRNSVADDELVAYFVRTVTSTIPTNQVLNGCASRSRGAAAVAQIASQWTLAHEIGHALGLVHISGENAPACTTPDRTRLMTGCSTSNLIGTPVIVQDEVDTMVFSNFTRNC